MSAWHRRSRAMSQTSSPCTKHGGGHFQASEGRRPRATWESRKPYGWWMGWDGSDPPPASHQAFPCSRERLFLGQSFPSATLVLKEFFLVRCCGVDPPPPHVHDPPAGPPVQPCESPIAASWLGFIRHPSSPSAPPHAAVASSPVLNPCPAISEHSSMRCVKMVLD